MLDTISFLPFRDYSPRGKFFTYTIPQTVPSFNGHNRHSFFAKIAKETMHIYTDKRTGIKYVSYTDLSGRRIRRSLGTRNKSVATVKISEVIDKQKAADSAKVPLVSFLERYRAFLSATRKPDTAAHFELGLKKLLSFKPNIEFLNEITPALLDECAITLKAKIKSPNAPGLNRAIRAIKTAMRQAEFWDLIPTQNWRKVSKFKESKGRVEFHTPAEIKQILKCFNADWQLVVLLGSRAGLRRGEMAALKWEDVDLKNNQLYVAPNKTEKHRYIPLAEDLRTALIAARKKTKGPWVVSVGVNRGSKDFLSKFYENETSALPFHCHLHKLRHTFASHLVQNGVDLYRVSKLLGHSSIQMTEIYAHLAPADLSVAIKKLPAIK